MKKVYMLGDFTSQNGPGIANKALKDGLDELEAEEIKYIYFKNQHGHRVGDIWRNCKKCDLIFIANYTRIFLVAILIGKVLRKPIVYRLHGFNSMENQINDVSNNIVKQMETDILERYIIRNVDKIICVSQISKETVCNYYRKYQNKFDYCYNSIEIPDITEHIAKRKEYTIISVGGGMRRKNNLSVTYAIDKFQKRTGVYVRFIVVGPAYSDKEEMCKYEFVEYHEFLQHEQLLELFSECNLYIQNSSFETFGLAALEALYAGCSLLLSKNMGVLEIFDEIPDDYIIDNITDVDEISRKMEVIHNQSNHAVWMQRLREKSVSNRTVAEYFSGLFKSYLE